MPWDVAEYRESVQMVFHFLPSGMKDFFTISIRPAFEITEMRPEARSRTTPSRLFRQIRCSPFGSIGKISVEPGKGDSSTRGGVSDA